MRSKTSAKLKWNVHDSQYVDPSAFMIERAGTVIEKGAPRTTANTLNAKVDTSFRRPEAGWGWDVSSKDNSLMTGGTVRTQHRAEVAASAMVGRVQQKRDIRTGRPM